MYKSLPYIWKFSIIIYKTLAYNFVVFEYCPLWRPIESCACLPFYSGMTILRIPKIKNSTLTGIRHYAVQDFVQKFSQDFVQIFTRFCINFHKILCKFSQDFVKFLQDFVPFLQDFVQFFTRFCAILHEIFCPYRPP